MCLIDYIQNKLKDKKLNKLILSICLENDQFKSIKHKFIYFNKINLFFFKINVFFLNLHFN